MRCPKCEFEESNRHEVLREVQKCARPDLPDCSFENPPGFDFCGQCAVALQGENGIAKGKAAASKPVAAVRIVEEDASPTIEGERKTVTALFADIKGSTELMEDLDPEEAGAIIDPALKLMMDAVHRYDGYVVQSTGDGIFALFGAPAAYEDHPQRGLYAANHMQRELRDHGERRVAAGHARLEARIGVNTGEVVARTVETDGRVEYTPIGHTANLASRLQTIAPAGSIAVSERTRKLIEGYFEIRALGPTAVRGISEAIDVYEVIGLGTLRTHLRHRDPVRHAPEQPPSQMALPPRLLDRQDRHEETRTMLAAIYNWFIEGFDTADLKDARHSSTNCPRDARQCEGTCF